LREIDGRFTGDLEIPPLVGEARASWLRDYADENGIDLERSYGYADSMSDLPLLEAVGIPVAVNPDVALHRLARARKWPVEEWDPEKGVSRVLIPSPAPDVGART
jgi:phosphoserine phosphatase